MLTLERDYPLNCITFNGYLRKKTAFSLDPMLEYTQVCIRLKTQALDRRFVINCV